MDALKTVSEPLNGFAVDSIRLLRRCNKPDRKGTYISISLALLHPLFRRPLSNTILQNS